MSSASELPRTASTASSVSASRRRLVRPVAQHAREPQRDAARVARARLDAVERDLDHELRPHVARRGPRAAPPATSSFSVCHASIASVRPLNVLPSITNPPSGPRAPRCRFESHPRRRPEPHSTAEHDQVERVDRLDLHPRRPAPARLVGRVQRLDDDALVALRQRRLEHAPARRAAPATRSGTSADSAAARSEPGRSSRSSPSRCSRSKNIGVSSTGAPERLANRDPGDLERVRPAVLAQRDRLAVEHERPPPAAPAPPRPPPGSRAVTSSSVRVKIPTASPSRWTWIRAPSSFHSTAAGPGLLQRGVHVRRRRGQHRRDRPPDLEPERRQRRPPRPAPPPRPRRGRRAASAPAAPTATGTPAAFATASPTTAASAPWRMSPEHQRAQERLLGRRRARQQRRQRRPARGHRPRAAQRRHAPRAPRRPPRPSASARSAAGGGSSRSDAQPTPEHALARRAGQVARARDALLGRQPAQRRREPLDLGHAARRRRGRPRWRRRARRTARRVVSRPCSTPNRAGHRRLDRHRPRDRAAASPSAASTVYAGVRDTRVGARPGVTPDPARHHRTPTTSRRLRELDARRRSSTTPGSR